MAIVAKRRDGGANGRGARSTSRYLVAAAILAVAALLAWHMTGARGGAPDVGEKPSTPTNAIPHASHGVPSPPPAPSPPEAAPSTPPPASARPTSARLALPEERGERRPLALAHTGTVMRAARAGAGIAPVGDPMDVRAPVFDNPTENFLLRYAGSNRHPMMLMPRFGEDAEEELRRILETDIVIYDDDDDETVADKEAVAALKQELLAAVSEGYSAAETLNTMREDNNRRVRERVKMQRELNSLLKEGKVEEAEAYFDAANAQLAAGWLPPLEFNEERLPKELRRSASNGSGQGQ